jgi:hypothetical protein
MRTITSSSDAGRRNLNEALVSFLQSRDDGRSSTSNIDPADYPDVLPTTWSQLTKSGLLKVGDVNGEKYELLPLGYLTALQLSMRSHAPQTRGKLGRIYRVRKDSFQHT